MQLEPCPDCGELKHPLKVCPGCDFTQLRRVGSEHRTVEQQASALTACLYPASGGYPDLHRASTIRPTEDLHSDLGGDEDNGQADDLAWDAPFIPNRHPSPVPAFPDDLDSASSGPPARQGHCINLRLASRIKKASIWLGENPSPTPPIRKGFKVEVFDGWACPETVNFARDFIAQNPAASLEAVHRAIIQGFSESMLPFPYLWWVWFKHTRAYPLYQDANHLPFIYLDTHWYLAYGLRHLGDLVGRQGKRHTAPGSGISYAYFICWENEDLARNHFLYRKLRQPAAQSGER